MPDTNFKTAAELAAELSISAQTLKSWSKEFAPFLSPPGALGDSARRFNAQDGDILRRVKDHLTRGLAFDETADELRQHGFAESLARSAVALPSAQQGFSVLTDTLRAMIENQQTIQNSLQVNRNLLGVIIQDNFNLKEENAKLRERMLKQEQELAEMKRRDADLRLYVEQRLNRLENALRAEMGKGFLSKLLGG
jgi:DNA-binding transcriptional MerR regulator